VSWEQIRGHEAVAAAFARAAARGRLAHAYLLVGPAGVGKRLFARELAKALLCEGGGDNLRACDRCRSCVLFDAGTHPDYAAAGRPEDSLELPIDVVRELCQHFGLKSARGRGKVAVLDDADDLNDAAANCFLKTLEEPPPRSVLLLIGTSPERQLPTIVSRCQVVRFAPLPPEMVRDLLRKRPEVDAALLDRLVRLSGGSPGQALELADPALWEFRAELLRTLSVPRPPTVELARSWLRCAEAAGKESGAQRRRAALLLRLLVDLLARALAWSVGSGPNGDDPSELAILEGLANRLGPDRLVELVQRCLDADYQIDRRVQLTLVLEALCDALAGPA
jgi:DNA polymerase-3 subunit delta'